MADRASRSSVGLGFRVHSGWAAVVAVKGPVSSPSVVDRRRIVLADAALEGSVQPFHAAVGKEPFAAEQLIQGLADSTDSLAVRSLQLLLYELRQQGYEPSAACILMSSGRALGTVESILASHALIHSAEGEFFRAAIRRASGSCGLPVTGIRERDILSVGAAELGLAAEAIQKRVLELGRSSGPPWQQDQKLAALGGWLVLARQ